MYHLPTNKSGCLILIKYWLLWVVNKYTSTNFMQKINIYILKKTTKKFYIFNMTTFLGLYFSGLCHLAGLDFKDMKWLVCKIRRMIMLIYPQTPKRKKKKQKEGYDHARFVRFPTWRANSVSILREMSRAFTECVNAPLHTQKKRLLNAVNHIIECICANYQVQCKTY